VHASSDDRSGTDVCRTDSLATTSSRAAGLETTTPGLGPRWIYPLKAQLTHLRSLVWQPRRSPLRPGIRILMYHRISDDHDELAVSPRRFAEQIELLAAQGYRVIDVEEVGRRLQAGSFDHTVGLSFDDGYSDVVEHALPVLQRFGFTATVFLPTGVIDGTTGFSWYRQKPRVLAWTDVVDLDRSGVIRFEAHTVTHPNLLVLNEDAAFREIADSRAALEDRLGRAVTCFSYPAGLFDRRERDLVAKAGFKLAVTCEPGVNDTVTDPLLLRRIPVDRRDRLRDLRAKVAGAHDKPLIARSVYRRLRYGVTASG
jgi:peptidoglycan/xylan/chitin deacetylase (PgdA/CDA1 family)